jgi:hypothetical protein
MNCVKNSFGFEDVESENGGDRITNPKIGIFDMFGPPTHSETTAPASSDVHHVLKIAPEMCKKATSLGR